MTKQYWKWLVCMIGMAMLLNACGKKEETPSQPTVVEIPIEEAETTQVIEEDEEEAVEEEVAVTEKDKGNTTDSKQVGSSTPKKNAGAITRSLESAPKYQYIEENVVPIEEKPLFSDNTQLMPKSGESSTNKPDKSDDSIEDSNDNSNDKSEDNATSNPTVTPQPEYPLTDADPLAKNIEVINGALWRERLLGNEKFSLPVKDFYFASKDVTPSQMKQEINSLVGQVPCIVDITYVTSHKDGIDLDSYVTVHVEEDTLFGSRKAFDDKYALAKKEHLPKVVSVPEVLCDIEFDLYSEMQTYVESIMDDMTEEEYAKLQWAIYEFLLTYAKKCDTTQYVTESAIDVRPYVYDMCYIPYEDLIAFLRTNKTFCYLSQYYNSIYTEKEKIVFLKFVAQILKEHVPDMCFWLEDISLDESQVLKVDFKMFGVYETVPASDGSVTLDKTKYKSIATMAKEVDDKINQVVENVIDPDMSTLAKEYAVLHYCDTYYKYDGDKILGDTYAIGDNPYTIGSPIDPSTGKKDIDIAKFSTQKDYGLYTTAMTGWGVCVGHAKFFQAICTKIGIRCEYEQGNGHAWNIVLMDGNAYMVDPGRRAPFPHFNIGHEWNDTYEVIDNKMCSHIKDDMRYAKSDSPIPLYQAGYVKDTTQQDGEWIYYINFDDNGSLYKINVDGSGNQKIKDSGTTIEAAYQAVVEKYGENKYWPDQWADAQYGQKYKGEGYTNSGAISYRWAVGHNFFVRKDSGSIVYEVINNPAASCSIPMTYKKTDCINLSWEKDAYYNLGIISGTISVDTTQSPGDSIDKIIAVVDGKEYPMSDVIIKEDGREADFTFRLPTDRGMEHHDLELFVTTANGGVKRQEVMTMDLHPTGIKESYLWNGKYYTINGITAKEGQLTIFVHRYTKEGQQDGTASLIFDRYTGKDKMNVPFYTCVINEEKGVFSICTTDGVVKIIQFVEDNRVAIETKKYEIPIEDVAKSKDNTIYIFSTDGFCYLAEEMAKGNHLDATVEVCADLDFSTLPENVAFKPIGTEKYKFKGEWHGNNYKMKGLKLEETDDVCVFKYINRAIIQDVYVCDSSISGMERTGIIFSSEESCIQNLWVENVNINSLNSEAGTIVYSLDSDISDIYLVNLKVEGDKKVGGLCATAENTVIDGVQLLGTSEIYGTTYVGGIVGYMGRQGSGNGSISNCISEAEIESSIGASIVGGIVGYIKSGTGIYYCLNYGDVSSYSNIGGIVGQCVSLTDGIIHVENYGNVEGVKCLGGIVGYHSDVTICMAVNGGNIIGEENVGGIIGRTSVMDEVIIRCALNKGEITGAINAGLMVGLAGRKSRFYHTLCTPLEKELTNENISRMIGDYPEESTIVLDDILMSYEAGRGAYYGE